VRRVQGCGVDHRVHAPHGALQRLAVGDIGNGAGGVEGHAVQPHHVVLGGQRTEDRAPDPPGTSGQQDLH